MTIIRALISYDTISEILEIQCANVIGTSPCEQEEHSNLIDTYFNKFYSTTCGGGGGDSLMVHGRKLHVHVGICQFIGGESSLNTCKIVWKFLRHFKPVRLLIDLYIKEWHILSY